MREIRRTQSILLPECLDGYVTDTHPVRVIDVFDLGRLGFDGVEPVATGRLSYHPEAMLKIYIYGYLNRIQSSRRLERETQRNVELMWLTGRLAPDVKTIDRVRKGNCRRMRRQPVDRTTASGKVCRTQRGTRRLCVARQRMDRGVCETNLPWHSPYARRAAPPVVRNPFMPRAQATHERGCM